MEISGRPTTEQRLLVVSNRLHLTLVEKNGKFSFEDSVGGVATGLRSYLKSTDHMPYLWIGWPGGTVDEATRTSLIAESLSKHNALPVFLAEEDMEHFYHGFCNKTIWPLFHYFPSYVTFEECFWRQYKSVNERYFEAIAEIAKPNDIVWIHDYQLMLLPKLLRERFPALTIGFFLHIPFPSFEVFRILPSRWRTEILEGILGADLIGLHTQDYCLYFKRCVMRILNLDTSDGDIYLQNRTARVDTFPMGIDYAGFHEAAGSEEVAQQKFQLKQTLGDAKVILSVDRLDYSKGILHRLQGYEQFLQAHPEWRERVEFLLIVVPSRVGVQHYQLMKKQIDETVGRINGRFGTLSWSPILYQYRTLVFHPLVALYCAADVMLVTPLRDGMNLIAKEYLASRRDNTGVLILSEMAGAAKELTKAIIVNPNYVDEISEAILEALKMSSEEQVRRNEAMKSCLKRYDLKHWANDFLGSLIVAAQRRQELEAKWLSTSIDAILDRFAHARSRVLFLDYDGTLVPFAGDPAQAQPTPQIIALLAKLAANSKNRVVIISGRERKCLELWFGDLPVSILAEHGVWARQPGHTWRLPKPIDDSWKNTVVPDLEWVADRLPGAFVEQKEFSTVLHYRNADPDLALTRLSLLQENLRTRLERMKLQALPGNKVLEIRTSSINKGSAATQFLSEGQEEFVVAIGDDTTDEDLFNALPPSSITIHVGKPPTAARYIVESPADVFQFLTRISQET